MSTFDFWRENESEVSVIEEITDNLPLKRKFSNVILKRKQNNEIKEAIQIETTCKSNTQSRVFTPPSQTDSSFEPMFKLSPMPSYSYSSRCLSEFETIEKIGKGAFGEVFKVKNHLDGCYYALKRIKLGDDDFKNSRILREVSALSRLSHPHIVRYYQAWIEEGVLHLGSEEDEEDVDNDISFDDDDMSMELDNSHLNPLKISGSTKYPFTVQHMRRELRRLGCIIQRLESH